MQEDTTAKNLLTISEASEYLGVSIDTIRRWDKKGKLPSFRSPGGHRYFKKGDLDHVFGRKYERSPETKPRAKKEDKEDIPESAPVTAEEVKTTINPESSSKNIGFASEDIPFFPTSVSDSSFMDKPVEKDSTNFLSPFSGDNPVFQPTKREVKIPNLSPIRVIQRQDIKKEINISIDNNTYDKREIIEETKIVERRESILVPDDISIRKIETKGAMNSEIYPRAQRADNPDTANKPSIKLNSDNLTGIFTVYRSYIIISFLGVLITFALIYFYLSLPQKPISPIP